MTEISPSETDVPGDNGIGPAREVMAVVDEKHFGESATATASTITNSVGDAGCDAVIEYPDGGLRAWGVVFGAALTQFCGYGYLSAFGVYQDYYTRIYMAEHSASAISWIGGIESLLMIAGGLVCGRLYDRGYCMFLLYGGTFVTSLSLFMLAFVKPNQYFGALLCQGLGVGLGGGMAYVPSLAIVSQYFEKRRAMAMSIVTAGVSLGATVNPILVNNLFARTNLGFTSVVLINAAFMTSVLLIACFLIKPRLPPPKKHAKLVNCLKKFSKDWAYIAMTTGFTLFALGFFFPVFYLQLAAITHGLDKTLAFYSLVILNGCSFLGRISCGFIARVVNVNHLGIISALISGCITFAFIAVESTTAVVFIGVLYGFFTGMYTAVMAPITNLLTDDVAELGMRLGISFACSGLGELIGPPIAGALLTGEYHWWRPAVFFGIVELAAAISFGWVELVVRHRRQVKQVREDTGCTGA
ncbi:MFS general substrate transporter [Macrolepiota fuliginosa MF-IS2]|uniref:MFS general substrate transporter n=1 Tax=Macrolepiota fuliginosa MF-IS2 TaxID=1400762 RepID=A0A9P5X8X5_9AGAR|nr:MFS general substrate transporter [Macrolepiota fuliginosa MF-IS2]